MNKNRAIVVLVVGVFVIVFSMVYVIFSSNKKDVVEVVDVQTFEEGHIFDIDNDINNRTEDEIVEELNDDIIVGTAEKIEDKENTPQKVVIIPETSTTIESSPKTGPGSSAAVMALVFGAVSAGVVYKKESRA
jgi:mevalonate kinase